jgi:hypothetical protein
VCSDFVRNVKQSGEITFVEDSGRLPGMYKIVFMPKRSDREPPELGSCFIQIKTNTIHMEHIVFDTEFNVAMETKHMFFILAIERIINITKEHHKNNIIVSTDYHMAPEVLLDFGFKIYSGLSINADDYLGIKKLDKDVRTDYSINSLKKLKKQIPTIQAKIPWFFLG